jgi:hypothetical protein
MNAELRWLQTSDFRTWEEFVAAERDPLDCSGWFQCGVGVPGDLSMEDFQFCAATASALAALKQEYRRLRFLLVDEFTREEIERQLHDFLARASGSSWHEIRGQLRERMYSEYESTKA